MESSTERDTSERSATEQAGRARAVLDVVRQLTLELYPGKTDLVLDSASSLEDDAGLDSLGRTELLRRLESRFQTRLAEERVIGAETIGDLIDAVGAGRAMARPSAAAPVTAPAGPEAGGLPERARTLVEALEWHVHRCPDGVHIHLLEGDAEQARSIRYRDLWDSAGRVAAGLRRLALEPGESVVIMLPTGAEFFFTFMGILLAGGVPVPIYPPVRRSQIEDHLRRQATILENAQAAILVTFPEAITVGRFLKTRLPQLRDVVTADELLPAPAGELLRPGGDDVALLQYTSGSTGNPKGVVLTHANLLANIRSMGHALEVADGDVFVSWLPLYHDMGLIGAWMGTLYYGVPLVLMSPLAFIARPQRWLWAIHRFRGTLSAAPNFAYDLCTDKIDDADLQGLDLSSLRFCCNGAEPVSADTIARFTERFRAFGFAPTAMAPVYGLAECSVGLTFPPVGRGPRIEHVEQEPFRTRRVAVAAPQPGPGTLPMVGCGRPLHDHEVRIVDETGNELPERHVGRLQFRGPSATRGYFRNLGATAELVRGEWLDSGDYAYMGAGEVFITGRAKDLIIRAGRNIYPYELEQAVGQIPGVRKGGVAVFASMDPRRRTERLVIVAETRERRPERHAELQRAIERTALETVDVAPDEIVLAPPRAVLKTSSGKIRRGACRDLYERGELGRRRPVWSQLVQLALTAAFPLVRRTVAQVKAYLYFAYAWAVFFLFTIPVWLLTVVLPGDRLRRTLVRGAIYLALACAGIPFHVRGQQRFPRERPCVVVANHASYIDALVLGAALPGRFGFVAKRELSRNPFLSLFLHRLGTFYVERFDARQSLEDVDRLLHAVRAGQALVFFPEGTFTRAPGIRPFRMGAFVAATHGALPVVPVVIRGTRSILRGAEWFPRRGRIDIEFLEPLEPEGEGWDAALRLRDRAREAILAHSDEPDLGV